MKRQLWRKITPVFTLLVLILSYILPIAAIAETTSTETTDTLTLLSAQTKPDDSGGSYLELKAMVSNQSQESVSQDILVKGNQLAEILTPKEMEGVSWVVGNSIISLTIAPMTQKEIELSFSVDEMQWIEGQGMTLISGEQELVVDETRTTINTESVPESETATTETESIEESQEQEEISEEETEDIEETDTYSPFIGPKLFTRKKAGTTRHTPIEPEYMTDTTGRHKYPKNSWQPTGQKDVINHQGNKDGSNQWDGVTEWDGNPDNRANSYIEYGGTGEEADFAIRKYARQTTTPGLFDVYLNVRGNYQKEVQPMDIVLVVDWSGSMSQEHRIYYAREGIKSFIDTLDSSAIKNDINLGFIGYSSDDSSYYSNLKINLAPFESVKTTIKEATPDSVRGGTFTQKALRDAGEMLSTDDGRKKIIVLLTDGVPTFSYKVSRVRTSEDGSYYGTEFRDRQDRPGNTSRISRPYDVEDQNKNKKSIDSTFIATIGEAMGLKEKGIEIHGLGIQLQSDGWAGLTEADVEDKMKQMVSSDENGDLYYRSVSQASEIVDYLISKAIGFSGTVSNGIINDPIAEPFSYVPNSLKYNSFGCDVDPTYSESNGVITATNINLVRGQEMQLHYQVRLKTETDDFKPDQWYQMNGKTTFQPKASEPGEYEFGVPSAKAPGVTIDLKKEWEEFDGDRSNRPQHVTLKIEREKTVDSNSWTNAFARIKQPSSDTTDTWERKAVAQLSAKSDEGYTETLYLPKYNNRGEDFNYQVTDEVAVDGYTHQVKNNVVTNTKVFHPYGLTIKKKSSASSELLKGAVFKLTGGGLDVTLIDNGNGTYTLPKGVTLDKNQTYTLTETKAPAGHELPEKTEWKIVVEKNGKVTIDGEAATITNHEIELTITNMFKKVPIAVWKYRQDKGNKEIPLAGATFELQEKKKGRYVKVSESTSKDDGIAIFDSVEPGEYRVVETKGPKGYDTRPGNYEFTVDIYGNINYSGENVKAGEKIWTLTHKNKLKPFDLIVNKLDDDKKALKGARFKLTGPELGEGIELPADGAELETFHFKDLKPGVYELTETFTPEGYRGLEKPVSITIHENGKVTIDGEVFDDLLVEGEGHNQVELDVTNYAKIKLPDTGGNGRLLIYLTGAAALIVAAGYLLFRFSHQKEVG